MSDEAFRNRPKPKFKQGDYITDGKDQEFMVDFVQWDFDREEHYYYPRPDTYAGKIYQKDAKLIDPPKHPALEAYEQLFGKRS